MSEVEPELTAALARAGRVVVLTGAGVSAESGVPTFRDAQTGLWARYSPEALATPEAFARDPHLVWRWYRWRRELVGRAAPNPGHLALAALERLLPEVTLVTQNVDGLHRRAGSHRVIELHGNILRTRCSREPHVLDEAADAADLPRCPRCDALGRPDVVWFGEPIPPAALEAATAAAGRCEVLLSVGTSSLVYPAAALPEMARAAGATIVEVNPQPTPLSARADFVLRGASGAVLPQLIEALHRSGLRERPSADRGPPRG